MTSPYVPTTTRQLYVMRKIRYDQKPQLLNETDLPIAFSKVMEEVSLSRRAVITKNPSNLD